VAFFRLKKIAGHEYVYEVENVKENGRWRQRTVRYVGPLDRIYEAHGSVGDWARNRRRGDA
jgi:hypothetical protein